MLDVHGLMKSLSERRPIFHSEADFQHELAWEIRKANPDTQIRLEHPLGFEEQKAAHLDIWLPNEKTAIELEYCTGKFTCIWNGEYFDLKYQGAQDTRRYDYLKDIQRLERFKCNRGFVVLLTNDPLYWNSPPRSGTIDAAFRIHELQEIAGVVKWRGNPAKGTISSRETPIALNGAYTMHWQDYSALSTERYGHFRYLALLVENQERLPKQRVDSGKLPIQTRNLK